MPLPRGIQNESGVLNTLAALSDSDLWLVGNGGIQGVSGTPLVIHFDGKQFTPVPFPGNRLNLAGITMIATDDAWITGSDGTTLAAHWDGKAWTRVPTPTAGQSSGLRGVSAISSTNVWAAGSFHEPNVIGANLVEHFDGKIWTISPIQPSTLGGFNGLVDALAFSDGNVFLAGSELQCQGTFCDGFASVIFHTSQGNN